MEGDIYKNDVGFSLMLFFGIEIQSSSKSASSSSVTTFLEESGRRSSWMTLVWIQ